MKLLLLAGTQEARSVAMALNRMPQVSVVMSLSRAEPTPRPFGMPARIGSFGGEDGFREFVARERFDAILDASDPFSPEISHLASAAAADLDLDYIQFLVPAWRPEEDDRWVFINTLSEVAASVEPNARVLVLTGRDTLPELVNLDRQTVFCRITSGRTSGFPMAKGQFVPTRHPMSFDDEVIQFDRLKLDWLVMRNSGGAEARPQIEAARVLGLPIAMLRRPLQPEVPRVETVGAAVAWARRRV
ncbi:MAG: precorrin-6A/cobalt-precorrin-6A reductase [Rhodobacteraceae bacterium]|nr:precorrin-6A/cobalt-precorrin-6A reductase [Paracoccaceae bacterium]